MLYRLWINKYGYLIALGEICFHPENCFGERTGF